METQSIITLGLGVGTILASGVMSAVVTSWLNRQKDQTQFLRTKAEALYLAADEFGRMLAVYTIRYYPLISGSTDWNQLNQDLAASGGQLREHGGAETVRMLTEIYFPSVRPAFKSLIDARTAFNTFTRELKREYERGGGVLDQRHWIALLDQKAGAVDDATEELKQAIVSAAQEYAGVKQDRANEGAVLNLE